MSLIVEKGQSCLIATKDAAPKLFTIGLGWEIQASPLDLDASVFALTHASGSPKLVDNKSICYFGNKTIQGVQHSGDNLTGAGDGDDETIKVALADVNANVQELAVFVTIYQAAARRQNFGMLKDAYIRILDENNVEVCRYDLDAEFATCTAVQIGSLVKDQSGNWSFAAVGAGFNCDLNDIANGYAN